MEAERILEPFEISIQLLESKQELLGGLLQSTLLLARVILGT